MRFMIALMMRVWLLIQQYNSQTIPRPLDAPRACIAGFSTDRVLIFGSGPAVGWGVISHEIALPGSFARALSSRSGRGADVEAVAGMRINAANALSALRRVDVDLYDVIVVVLGANDAVPLTPLPKWQARLSELLSHLGENSSPAAQIFVTGVPPIRSVPGFGTRLGSIAQDHAARMNLVTAELCESSPRATFVPLPAVEELPSARYRDGRTYRHWANVIAEVVAPQLHSVRWGSPGEVHEIGASLAEPASGR